jgi:AraC family transcriptional regulator
VEDGLKAGDFVLEQSPGATSTPVANSSYSPPADPLREDALHRHIKSISIRPLESHSEGPELLVPLHPRDRYTMEIRTGSFVPTIPDSVTGRGKTYMPSPTLSGICIGPSTVVESSVRLSWVGFLLERQIASPEMLVGNHADRHLLAMVCSPVMKGEHRTKSGRLVPIRKTSGAITLIPQGPVPELQLIAETELVYCTFDDEFIGRIVTQMDGKRPRDPEFRSAIRDRSLNQIFSLLAAEFIAGNPTGRIYAESLAEVLAIRFLRFGGTSLQVKASALPSRKLSRVKELIEASLDQDLTLKSLAKESGYSRAHFLRMFREATGMTPHQYVIQRRILNAEKLLARDDVSLADIAVACGFSSQAHFTLAFRKQLAVTPAEYRRGL